MLKLLLDEHLSPEIAVQVRNHDATIAIVSVQEWRDGEFLGADDAVLLCAAREQRLTLVTFDQQTIRPLLARWAAEGIHHGGVVFVSHKSITQNNRGALVNAILALWERYCSFDWTDLTLYLRAQVEGES